MINPRSGTTESRKRLTDIVNSTMLRFPLAGMTIHGRSVFVSVNPELDAAGIPGCAGMGGMEIAPFALSTWTNDELIFLVLHEWMHVFGNHAMRRGDKDAEIWNIACDYRINADVMLILGEKKVPQGGLEPPAWVGALTPEEIYDKLVTNKPSKPKAGSLGTGDVVPQNMSDPTLGSSDAVKEAIVQELCAAEAALSLVNKSVDVYGSYIKDRLAELKKGTVPWGRLILGNILGDLGGTFATYSPPRRKYFPFLILPSARQRTERKLAILVDVSASVGPTVLNEFASNIGSAAARAQQILVCSFDAVVREQFITRNAREAVSKLKFATGIHSYTDACGAFEAAAEFGASSTVCLTDGHIRLPPEPHRNTTFAIPTGGKTPPWGRTFTMDIAW